MMCTTHDIFDIINTVTADMDEQDAQKLIAFTASQILLGASNMKRRVFDRVRSDPLIFLVLAESPAEQP